MRDLYEIGTDLNTHLHQNPLMALKNQNRVF